MPFSGKKLPAASLNGN